MGKKKLSQSKGLIVRMKCDELDGFTNGCFRIVNLEYL